MPLMAESSLGEEEKAVRAEVVDRGWTIRRDSLRDFDRTFADQHARRGEVFARVRQMRSHGMTSSSVRRMRAPSMSYDMAMLGYDYRMAELRAAVGLAPSSHHIMPIVLPAGSPQHQVMTRMRDAGFQAADHSPPIHLVPPYQNRCFAVSLPRARNLPVAS